MIINKEKNEFGLGLKPGSKHYRAFVGPPEKYDIVSAMQFNLLTFMGLREHHYLLDIGCGSLRAGRLIIPYLLPERYYGIEPEKWLVEEGLKKEIGQDQFQIKRPQLMFSANFEFSKFGKNFDFMIAQSIFSHASQQQIKLCLREVASCLKPKGIFLATFLIGNKDYLGTEWVYPGCVKYKRETMEKFANNLNLAVRIIDWPHPNGQTWAIFSHENYINKVSDPTYKLCARQKYK